MIELSLSRQAKKHQNFCFKLAISASLTLLTLQSYADVLPTDGIVTTGSAVISQTGNDMTVTQSSNQAVIDWQTFSIGSNSSVTFNQPSTSAVALNHVLGSDVSVIQGALNANGQVFLINPNGVLFTPSAQVNVGGIVASALNISTDDFLSGHYRFNGGSSKAVINQGNITAANGGTIALIAAKISNTGNLNATGGNVLLGAGSKVTLDLNGAVKLIVEKAAVRALIEQGGAIQADGGTVLLTAKAAGNLVSTVINNTGVIEAKTLATGEKGQILLLGDFDNDRVIVNGTLDASAVNGDGGFIETSAANVSVANTVHVTAAAMNGKSGTWLIDPTDITISASSCTGTNCIAANTIASTLSGGTDVSIATAGTGSDVGNITINAPIAWSSNMLTLTAHNNININADLTATGTGALALEYGQGSADGSGSTYTIANGTKVYIPSASNFTWKKGSAAAITNLVFNNNLLRFGDGAQASIDTLGQLKQPFYYEDSVDRTGWFKLTYSNYPLDLEVGLGGDGTSSWNRNGELHNTNNDLASKISNQVLEISGYKEGFGSIVSSVTVDFDSGDSVKISNKYTLGQTASFVKTDTSITNVGSATVSNVRLWVGTRDDYIAQNDSPTKFKGNLTASGFTPITIEDTQAKALLITENDDGVTGAAVLFYSTSAGADSSIDDCCDFTNATELDPRTSPISIDQDDGSYALFIRMTDLAVGQSNSMTWYYAAGPVANINDIVSQVAASAGTVPYVPAPAVTLPPSSIQRDAAIGQVQSIAGHVFNPLHTVNNIFNPSDFSENTNQAFSVGDLAVVEIDANDVGSSENDNTSDDSSSEFSINDENERDKNGFMQVFVVDGGIKMPAQQ
ncbi:MAG: filamentous hemagglutinin N-terminal domain-containing protein [Gammaproteobacteria bacterium]|nr:filamentous hemagglutinin N-terminal domain-containing protein [Gammaproteobacteria bacterium]